MENPFPWHRIIETWGYDSCLGPCISRYLQLGVFFVDPLVSFICKDDCIVYVHYVCHVYIQVTFTYTTFLIYWNFFLLHLFWRKKIIPCKSKNYKLLHIFCKYMYVFRRRFIYKRKHFFLTMNGLKGCYSWPT